MKGLTKSGSSPPLWFILYHSQLQLPDGDHVGPLWTSCAICPERSDPKPLHTVLLLTIQVPVFKRVISSEKPSCFWNLKQPTTISSKTAYAFTLWHTNPLTGIYPKETLVKTWQWQPDIKWLLLEAYTTSNEIILKCKHTHTHTHTHTNLINLLLI